MPIDMPSILKLKKVFKLPLRLFDRIFRFCIAYYEKFSIKQADYPPIFIIGAPRSGSTLLLQAIIEVFDLGYISNCHCNWYGAPALAGSSFTTRNRAKASLNLYMATMGKCSL